MWKWIVTVSRGGRIIELTSKQSWDEQWKAQVNLEARINRSVPDTPDWQDGDILINAEVVWSPS